MGIKMCPSLIRKLFSRKKGENMNKKSRAKSSNIKTKKEKTKLKSNSYLAVNRDSLDVPNSNNINMLQRKKDSDDLNNFNLSDISENENYQLFRQINNSILSDMNEKVEPNKNEKFNKKADSNNFNEKAITVYEKIVKSEETLSLNKKQKEKSFKEIINRFSSKDLKTKQSRNRSRSNDIILIRI